MKVDVNNSNFGNQSFIYLIAIIAALGGLLFGYDTGIIAGALIFIQQSFQISTFTKEMIVSSVVFGALFGAIISGHLANKFGRRRMLIIASIGFILGTLVAALAPDIKIMIAGRLIIGLAIGISSYTAPLFISELAPAKNRGALVLFNGIAITAGEVLAFLVDYLLIPTHSWRYMFATGLIPAIALLIGMLFMPSSPRWMALQGLIEKAHITLRHIRGRMNVEEEFNEILHSLSHPKGRWKDVFSRRMMPVLIIGLGLGILQQYVGINTVMYYGPFIFKAGGFHSAAAQILAAFGMGLVNTIMTIVAVFLVDYLGRRPLLLGGMITSMLSLVVVGFLFTIKTQNPIAHWLIIFFMITYVAGYSISLGSLFWLIISEIFPLHVRGLAMGFVTAVQWLANFIVACTFLTILNTVGASITFWMYSVVCLIAFVFSYFLVPETKSTTLEKIEDDLMQGKGFRGRKKADAITNY